MGVDPVLGGAPPLTGRVNPLSLSAPSVAPHLEKTPASETPKSSRHPQAPPNLTSALCSDRFMAPDTLALQFLEFTRGAVTPGPLHWPSLSGLLFPLPASCLHFLL